MSRTSKASRRTPAPECSPDRLFTLAREVIPGTWDYRDLEDVSYRDAISLAHVLADEVKNKPVLIMNRGVCVKKILHKTI